MSPSTRLQYVIIRNTPYVLETTEDVRKAEQALMRYEIPSVPVQISNLSRADIEAFTDDFDGFTSDKSLVARVDDPFEWTIKIKVDGMWVADGFDLTPENIQDRIRQLLPYATGEEVDAVVVQAPDQNRLKAAQSGVLPEPFIEFVDAPFPIRQEPKQEDVQPEATEET